MFRRNRLQRIERQIDPPAQSRVLVQVTRLDGEKRPTDEEVEAWKAETEAAGLEPCLIRIRIVNAPHERTALGPGT